MQFISQAPLYYVGDVPSAPLVLELDEDTSDFDTVTVTLTGPDGEAVSGATATIDGSAMTVTLTDGTLTPFALRGIYVLVAALAQTSGDARIAVAPLYLVADSVTGWLTLDEARTRWPDAPEDPASLFEVLESARIACEAFAPALEEGAAVPVNYKAAQLLQARAIWNSSRATGADRIGDGEYGVTVFPLDWNVKQQLRPKPGVPVVV